MRTSPYLCRTESVHLIKHLCEDAHAHTHTPGWLVKLALYCTAVCCAHQVCGPHLQMRVIS